MREESNCAKIPKVCGNCALSNFNLKMAWATATVHTLSRRVLAEEGTIQTGYLSSTLIEAVEGIATLYKWKAECKKEKVLVGMFEQACYAWQPRENLRNVHNKRRQRS